MDASFLVNKSGKVKNLTKIEHNFRCVCGNDMFIKIGSATRYSLENNVKFSVNDDHIQCNRCGMTYESNIDTLV